MENETKKSKYELWVHNKWRPAVGWSYVIICLFDFFLAPIFYSLLQILFFQNITAIQPWEPLTLKAGGLYHFSMMAIVGVTSYGRTREKIESGINAMKMLRKSEREM